MQPDALQTELVSVGLKCRALHETLDAYKYRFAFHTLFKVVQRVS